MTEYNILPGDRFESAGKAEMVAKYQNIKDLYDSLTLCKFAPYTPTQICKFIQGITGWDFTPDELLIAGERSMDIKRDKLPNMELMLKEYYAYRKWDMKTGKPMKEKLLELGLNQAAADLYAAN